MGRKDGRERRPAAGRKATPGVVVGVQSQADLLQVVDAYTPSGGCPNLLDCRQEQTDEDGNDGNHDEQLDQLLDGYARDIPLTIRLVKGAYWEHETVEARQHGWSAPVYEAKNETDRSFERIVAAGRIPGTPATVDNVKDVLGKGVRYIYNHVPRLLAASAKAAAAQLSNRVVFILSSSKRVSGFRPCSFPAAPLRTASYSLCDRGPHRI